MSTENTVSPDAETQNPAAEAEPTVPAKEEVAPTEQKAETVVDEADKALQRMQRRIDKRTADVYRTKAENDQLRERLAKLEASSGEQESAEKSVDPVALAREISRVERFTEQSNRIVSEGTKAHPDYMVALRDLVHEVGTLVQPNGMPSPFMEVVSEVSDKPELLLYHLGKNLDLAEELADLSPYKLAKRLARIERDLEDSAKPQSSKAPSPLEPINGKSKAKPSGSEFDQMVANARRGYMNTR